MPVHVVVSYDISNDRKRKKVSDLLSTLLVRVQRSVFEGEVPSGPLDKVVAKAVERIDREEGDSLRVYRLCAGCAPRVEAFGTFAQVEEEDVRIF